MARTKRQPTKKPSGEPIIAEQPVGIPEVEFPVWLVHTKKQCKNKAGEPCPYSAQARSPKELKEMLEDGWRL